MNYELTCHFLASSNKVNKIACYDYRPLSKPSAVLQITHGMNESINRYEHFIDFLTERGIAVVAHDHLGHGKSVENEEDYGYFAPEKGYMRLVDDLSAVSGLARKLYPDLPLAIFAHSMGSFVTRLYLTEYAGASEYPDACVICGTSGPLRAVNFGITAAEGVIRRHGERYRSKILNRRISKGYNSRYLKVLTPYDWLTRDMEVIAAYAKDKNSRFIFTASGFKDLFTLVKLTSRSSWYPGVPKDLPIYIISGEMDPVGQFGRGTEKVYTLLKAEGANVKLDLYPECRHELINELNKDEVFANIYSFLKNSLGI